MDHETRAALDAHQAGALRWLGGGVIAVVLGILLGVATVALAGSTGRRFPGMGIAVISLVFVGIVAIGVGVGALVRTVRWRRALARTPWQRGRLRIAGPAIIAFEPAGYDELDPDDEPVRLKLLSTAIWRTRAVQGLDGAEVRAAPVGSGQWVITADGLGMVYGAGVVRKK
ncbi:hypothetical protein E4P40_27070 [Blastococcus sp. CT_GayMR20]|uniref:hypothetical protein n=1 Tax=Blastococcus sp. CT_GayMR20 TaxID=2559609 RepID=UPI001073296C|nr:hypothetical protein [Blastococcus sp. CT_GayMR20]TFV64388.1 hypothetical protein E4P40_27070 [Blastococcus sp. CT_GayMR20]